MAKDTQVRLHDVLMTMEFARKNLEQMPAGASLEGMNRPLTAGERLGLAYLWAGLQMAGALGVDTTSLLITLHTPDSEPVE